jgi:hypothetical protein
MQMGRTGSDPFVRTGLLKCYIIYVALLIIVDLG